MWFLNKLLTNLLRGFSKNYVPFSQQERDSKVRKVHLEVCRVQVSKGLRNEINPSLTTAPFSVRIHFLGKSCDGSWEQSSNSILLFIFYLSFSSKSISLSNVTSFPS